ncbi:8452_t:CDS:1, partial [Entrophospora sp. SA101]
VCCVGVGIVIIISESSSSIISIMMLFLWLVTTFLVQVGNLGMITIDLNDLKKLVMHNLVDYECECKGNN